MRVLTSDIPEKAKVVRRPGGWLLVVQTGQVSEELADLLDELLGQYA